MPRVRSGRLEEARQTLSKAFDAVMHEHWLRGEEAFSNVSVARMCGVDEKIVRQWRTGDKPMPLAALLLLPSQLYSEMLGQVDAGRGRTPKRALVQMRQALADLDGQLAHEDLDEVVRALSDLQTRAADLAMKAMANR